MQQGAGLAVTRHLANWGWFGGAQERRPGKRPQEFVLVTVAFGISSRAITVVDPKTRVRHPHARTVRAHIVNRSTCALFSLRYT